jgi:hypothetical protein
VKPLLKDIAFSLLMAVIAIFMFIFVFDVTASYFNDDISPRKDVFLKMKGLKDGRDRIPLR